MACSVTDISFFSGSNWVSASTPFHLRTETHSASKTVFFSEYQVMDKPSTIYHCWNPSGLFYINIFLENKIIKLEATQWSSVLTVTSNTIDLDVKKELQSAATKDSFLANIIKVWNIQEKQEKFCSVANKSIALKRCMMGRCREGRKWEKRKLKHQKEI